MARTSTDAAAVAAVAATAAQPLPTDDFVNTLPVHLGDREYHIAPNFALLQRVEREVGGVIPFIDRMARRQHSVTEVAAAMKAIITMQPLAPKAADIPAMLAVQPNPKGAAAGPGGFVYYTTFLLSLLSVAVTGGVVQKEGEEGNGAVPDGAA